ncbi:MAG: gephyrin-like molybdotransferase Glp [Pseudomonadota bacterium]|nr:gephyrin-like molybdotransferase Glp [Pseudomonadota bacterium]
MLSVEEALRVLRDSASPLQAETVGLEDACGRVLAEDLAAAIAQPPFAASAMDGYAVRLADVRGVGSRLRVIGEVRAGGVSNVRVETGTAVRIFTGAAVPEGADHVLIQEDAQRDGSDIIVKVSQQSTANIRAAGIDFEQGSLLKRAGSRLSPVDISLAAAANIATLRVTRRPAVAFFDNGDELREPGSELLPGQIVGSNRYALGALIGEWGAEPRYLGRAADTTSSIQELYDRASGADVLAPIGGASVGDYDYVRAAFAEAGGRLIFEKIAVRPGKPTWFGELGGALVLGLPGNPASAIVCAALFLRPLIARLLGVRENGLRFVPAVLAGFAPANGPRETYLRGKARFDGEGRLFVEPAGQQDSSLLAVLAASDALIRRRPNAPAAQTGTFVDCLFLRPVE